MKEMAVDLICRLPSPEYVIHSEKNRLTQVVSNFLSNACKYTSEGSITMGYEKQGDTLRFFVTDTGKGIAGENVPHVFERFAKFDSFVQGTGLGFPLRVYRPVFGGRDRRRVRIRQRVDLLVYDSPTAGSL